MRLLTTVLCFLVVACVTAPLAFSQDFVPTPVEISKEKVNVNGEIFYLHKVLQKQTLYSISKAYGVTADAIEKANPALSEGLKAGMLLYIPQAAAAETVVQATDSTEQIAAQTSDRPKAEKEKSQRTVKKKKYRKYNVKWYETLDDVAVKFNVTVDAIIALNDIDTASGKRIRGIMIPDKEFMSSMQSGLSVKEDSVATSTPQSRTQDTEAIPEFKRSFEAYDDGPYIISIVLPFNASRLTDEINAYAADFYAGILTAAGEMKEKGMMEHFVLNTVDLSRYSSSWEMIASGALKGSELIIGPISERDLQPVAAFARNRHIPVVSPLDLNTASLAEGNPYFYLFPPQSELALAHLIERMSEDNGHGTASSITVIYESGTDSSDLTLETFAELRDNGLPFKTFSYDFLRGRGIDSLMRKSMSPRLVNKVIIPSMNEAFITDALRNLNVIKSSRNYDIEVYGLSRWKNYETIELNYFHALDLRLAMAYHIDYNDSLTVDFINRYREAFNTEPTSFSYQGYDILTFFVEAMSTYGQDFPTAIINERKSLLQSDVLFLPTAPGSGFENRAFKDICFTRGWTILTER